MARSKRCPSTSSPAKAFTVRDPVIMSDASPMAAPVSSMELLDWAWTGLLMALTIHRESGRITR